MDKRKRKILEAFYIRKMVPSLNDQTDIKSLKLFRIAVINKKGNAYWKMQQNMRDTY